MSKRKRIAVTLSESNFLKLEETAERYGITTNSFMAFVLGQWVDQHFEEQRLIAEKVNQNLSVPEDVFKNPEMLEMIKEILTNDEEFKSSAKNKMDNI